MASGVASFLQQVVAAGASDLLLAADASPRMRVGTRLEELSPHVLSRGDVRSYLQELLTPAGQERLDRGESMKFITESASGRFRGTVYPQSQGLTVTLRWIRPTPESLAELGVPPIVEGWLTEERGLVIVAGGTRSGKSTTLAAMIQHINLTQSRLVVTLEETIEFVHPTSRSVVIQRLMDDAPDTGIEQAQRDGSQVLVVDGLGDSALLPALLEAAESSLVLVTMGASSVTDALGSALMGLSGRRRQAMQAALALNLKGILVQRLLPKVDLGAHALAVELLTVNRSVRRLLRAGRIRELRHTLSLGAEGCRTMRDSILALTQAGTVDPGVATAELSSGGGSDG